MYIFANRLYFNYNSPKRSSKSWQFAQRYCDFSKNAVSLCQEDKKNRDREMLPNRTKICGIFIEMVPVYAQIVQKWGHFIRGYTIWF